VHIVNNPRILTSDVRFSQFASFHWWCSSQGGFRLIAYITTQQFNARNNRYYNAQKINILTCCTSDIVQSTQPDMEPLYSYMLCCKIQTRNYLPNIRYRNRNRKNHGKQDTTYNIIQARQELEDREQRGSTTVRGSAQDGDIHGVWNKTMNILKYYMSNYTWHEHRQVWEQKRGNNIKHTQVETF
jgi:hypothetical protein